MKKYQFKTIYESWNQSTIGNNIVNIQMIDEFSAMIKSGEEALEWICELLEQHPTWILIMILNGLYDKQNHKPPFIPFKNRSKLKEVSKIHLEHLKQKLKK